MKKCKTLKEQLAEAYDVYTKRAEYFRERIREIEAEGRAPADNLFTWAYINEAKAEAFLKASEYVNQFNG